jgi:hypothetical protein
MRWHPFVVASVAIIVATVASCQTPTTSVEVVNRRDAPVPVLSQTVFQPVQGAAGRALQRGESELTLELMKPPEGKMVVIEYITIRVDSHDKTANALLELWGSLEEGKGGFFHHLDALPPPISVGLFYPFQQMLTQHVLLYSWGPVRLHINRGSKNTAVSQFNVKFSGYLVEAP